MWCNRPLKRLSTQPNCRLPPACRSWENVPHLGPMCCGTDRPHRRHQQSLNPRMVTLHRLFILSFPPIFHPTSSTQFSMTCSFIHDPSHVSLDLSFQKHPTFPPPHHSLQNRILPSRLPIFILHAGTVHPFNYLIQCRRYYFLVPLSPDAVPSLLGACSVRCFIRGLPVASIFRASGTFL